MSMLNFRFGIVAGDAAEPLFSSRKRVSVKEEQADGTWQRELLEDEVIALAKSIEVIALLLNLLTSNKILFHVQMQN
jgi:hypothetical protein